MTGIGRDGRARSCAALKETLGDTCVRGTRACVGLAFANVGGVAATWAICSTAGVGATLPSKLAWAEGVMVAGGVVEGGSAAAVLVSSAGVSFASSVFCDLSAWSAALVSSVASASSVSCALSVQFAALVSSKAASSASVAPCVFSAQPAALASSGGASSASFVSCDACARLVALVSRAGDSSAFSVSCRDLSAPSCPVGAREFSEVLFCLGVGSAGVSAAGLCSGLATAASEGCVSSSCVLLVANAAVVELGVFVRNGVGPRGGWLRACEGHARGCGTHCASSCFTGTSPGLVGITAWLGNGRVALGAAASGVASAAGAPGFGFERGGALLNSSSQGALFVPAGVLTAVLKVGALIGGGFSALALS